MSDFIAGAIKAVRNRSPDQLDAAFSTTEEATQFRDEVLPTLEPADCRWFWEQVCDPDQFQHVAQAVVDVAAAVARQEGFTLGRDYSVGIDGTGLAQLLATAVVLNRVMAQLPPQRASALKALVRVLP